MNNLLDVNGKPSNPKKKQSAGLDAALFRWILLLIVSMASKVLTKEEVMKVYVLVNRSVGHSTTVDGLHSEVIKGIERIEKQGE